MTDKITTQLDPFAMAREDRDAALLDLFRQWIAACEARDFISHDDEIARDKSLDTISDLEDAILALPAGPVGLAIKVFFQARLEASRWTPSCALLMFNPDGTDDPGDWFASMLRDAAALVPVIGELAAPVIHEDAVLIAADLDLQWVQVVWADKPSSEPGFTG